MKKILFCIAATFTLVFSGCSGSKSDNSSTSASESDTVGAVASEEAEQAEEVEPDGDDYAYLAECIADGDELSEEDYISMIDYMEQFAATAKAKVAEIGPFTAAKRAEYAELNRQLADEYPFMHDFAGAVVKGVQSAKVKVTPEVVKRYQDVARLLAVCQGIKW